MRKLLIALPVVLVLGGCATPFGQKLQSIFDTLTSPINPTALSVSGNTFDAVENTAASYLRYCHTFKPNYPPECALSIRQRVVSGIRTARAARNQLEPYITSGQTAPLEVYNALQAAINALEASIPPVTTGAPK
jgi:hypothetical protein